MANFLASSLLIRLLFKSIFYGLKKTLKHTRTYSGTYTSMSAYIFPKKAKNLYIKKYMPKNDKRTL